MTAKAAAGTVGQGDSEQLTGRQVPRPPNHQNEVHTRVRSTLFTHPNCAVLHISPESIEKKGLANTDQKKEKERKKKGRKKDKRKRNQKLSPGRCGSVGWSIIRQGTARVQV